MKFDVELSSDGGASQISVLVMLIKLADATTASALEGFTAKLCSIAVSMCQTLTYNQGKEMARHAELTVKYQRDGVLLHLALRACLRQFQFAPGKLFIGSQFRSTLLSMLGRRPDAVALHFNRRDQLPSGPPPA